VCGSVELGGVSIKHFGRRSLAALAALIRHEAFVASELCETRLAAQRMADSAYHHLHRHIHHRSSNYVAIYQHFIFS